MVPDRQKVWTDGRTEWTDGRTDDAKTISLRLCRGIKLIQVLPYNCLYLNKGNNSSVKGSILTKLIGYRECMVLIICTKNESNLTNRY